MPVWLATILEIIKVTVPALIVFLTVYYLVKNYLDSQYQIKMLEYKQNQQKTTIPLRLQAYERLSLFCERINIPSMILRLREEDMSASDLRVTLMVNVQREFEHNITQQVYVSDKLWQIILFSRDDVINILNMVYSQIEPGADAKVYSRALFDALNERELIPLDKSLVAIKKEASLLM